MTPEEVEVKTSLDHPTHKHDEDHSQLEFLWREPGTYAPYPGRGASHQQSVRRFFCTNFRRPRPVRFPPLGLIVKYGGDITVTEAKTQLMLYTQLKGRVPIPEVFGWTEDGGQAFIYMSLIDGEPLERRWAALNEGERVAVCSELNGMVKASRSLEQPGQRLYVGGLDNQPLNDIFLYDHRDLAGPFHGPDAVPQFQTGCDIKIDGPVPVVFTHAHLVPPNILLSPGPNPVVVAVIDWGQAGWYPAYWE